MTQSHPITIHNIKRLSKYLEAFSFSDILSDISLMNLYLVCFRLNITLFILSNIASLFIYMKTHDLFFALIIKLLILPLIFFIQYPFVKRYNYFFHNQGWGMLRILFVTGFMDLLLFFSLIAGLSFIP